MPLVIVAHQTFWSEKVNSLAFLMSLTIFVSFCDNSIGGFQGFGRICFFFAVDLDYLTAHFYQHQNLYKDTLIS